MSDIDVYLKSVPAPHRGALQKLRKQIRAVVPAAEECISYRIPAFRVKGGIVAGFMARKGGCSYLPFSGSTLPALKQELKDYSQTKSSLHFDSRAGLPLTLVRKLIKTRLAELPKK